MPDEARTQPEPSRPVNAAERCPEDREAIREAFRKHPPQTWRVGLALVAEESAIGRSGHALYEETTRAGAETLRRELEAESASTLERLAIDHVVLCWLTYHTIDFAYTSKLRDTIAIAARDYWDRHIEAAQRRYMRALETLARLRRLRLPAVQVNIAARQTNIAS